MDKDQRDELIGKYRDGYRAVAEAVKGMSDEELDRRPEADDWTAREVVHHLADSEMRSALRLRRLLAEDEPQILGYDEQEYVRRLHYDRPIQASLGAFRAARESTAEILDRLAEDEWARQGTHSETGPYSVEMWLIIYSMHAHNHAGQIRRAAGGEG
jgi:DinB family protein